MSRAIPQRSVFLTSAVLVGLAWFCTLFAAPPETSKPAVAKAEPPKLREWTDATGKFRTSAEFLGSKNGTVTLKTSSKNVELPFEKLSTADQLFILRDAIPLSDATARLLVGKVVGVTDGDTITLLDFDKDTSKIRLEAIDAPESHQDFGTQAKKALSEKVFGKYARVEWKERDKYKRILGNIFIDDHFVNIELVEEGFAWHYKQYSKDGEFAAAEVRAREGKLGLWLQPKPTAPWDFRNKPAEVAEVPTAPAVPKRAGRAADAEPEVKEVAVYVTKTGAKYHRVGCRYLSKSQISISLADAKARYSACSVCNPP